MTTVKNAVECELEGSTEKFATRFTNEETLQKVKGSMIGGNNNICRIGAVKKENPSFSKPDTVALWAPDLERARVYCIYNEWESSGRETDDWKWALEAYLPIQQQSELKFDEVASMECLVRATASGDVRLGWICYGCDKSALSGAMGRYGTAYLSLVLAHFVLIL